MLDADGTVIYGSPANERVLGYAPEALVGRNGLAFVHPDDLPHVRRIMAQAARQPSVPLTVEHRFRHQNGSWRTLETVVQNLLQHPAVKGVVVHSQDVTERNRLSTQLQQTKLQLRRLQLHPHLIFNMLQAIQGHIRPEPVTAEAMIERLADLLRLAFQNAEEQEVPLEQEVTFLRRYLEIQQMRFPHRLCAEFAVDEEARQALVPNLLLQPLVENAVMHGLDEGERPGRLTVRAHRRGERLHVTVSDNGVGLPPEGMACEGVGLASTRLRLHQLYGDSSRFSLHGAPGKGVTVYIELPYCRAF